MKLFCVRFLELLVRFIIVIGIFCDIFWVEKGVLIDIEYYLVVVFLIFGIGEEIFFISVNDN